MRGELMGRLVVALGLALLVAGCDGDGPSPAQPPDAGADAPWDTGADVPVDVPESDPDVSLDVPEPDVLVSPNGFAKRITVDRVRVGEQSTTFLSNYPLLVSLVDPDLRHRNSGGKVLTPLGDDLRFEADSPLTCAGPAPCALAHEIEEYNGATGTLVAWVRVPVLNGVRGGENTSFRLRYGAQGLPSGPPPQSVWNEFSGVWHFTPKNGDPRRATQDSSPNGNHGVPASEMSFRTASGFIASSAQLGDEASRPVAVADSESLDLSASGYVSAWYSTGEGLISYRGIVSKGPRSWAFGDRGTVNYGLQLTTAGGVSWHMGNGTEEFHVGVNQHRQDAGTLGYYHLVVVWEQGMLWIYDDGALTEAPQAIPFTPAPNDLPLLLGGFGIMPPPTGGNPPFGTFSGSLDEIRVSKTPRGPAWIATDFRSQRDPTAFLQVGPEEALTP